jgi:hypothetical protein
MQHLQQYQYTVVVFRIIMILTYFHQSE